MASPMRTISLPSGDQISVLGQGTWGLGESRGANRRPDFSHSKRRKRKGTAGPTYVLPRPNRHPIRY